MVREFAIRVDAPVGEVVVRCAAEGVNPGLPLGDDGLLVALTEQRSRADIDRLAPCWAPLSPAPARAPARG